MKLKSMPKPQVSPECQQYMKVFPVNNGTSASIFNIKRNLMDVTLTQVSGGACNGKTGLQLLRKSLPISILGKWGSIAQLTEVITVEGNL